MPKNKLPTWRANSLARANRMIADEGGAHAFGHVTMRRIPYPSSALPDVALARAELVEPSGHSLSTSIRSLC